MLKMKLNKSVLVVVSLAIVVGISSGLLYLNLNKEKEVVVISGMIPYKTEDELILDSDLIVRGTVKEIKDSKWSNPGLVRGEGIRNILQTDIVVTTEELLSGELENGIITVRINKGEDENTIVHSDGYPDFFVGERVLLFLSRDNGDVATDEDYYVLTGMEQGKYVLSSNSPNTLRPDDSAVYTSEKGDLKIETLKPRIDKLYAENPNYKAERAVKRLEIIERNKELFGE